MDEFNENMAFLRGQKLTNFVVGTNRWLWKSFLLPMPLVLVFYNFSNFVSALLLLIVMVSAVLITPVAIFRMYLEDKYEIKAINLGVGEHGMCSGRSIGLNPNCNHGASYKVGGGGSFTILCLCCRSEWEKLHTASEVPPSAGVGIRRAAIPIHDGRCFDTPGVNIAIVDG